MLVVGLLGGMSVESSLEYERVIHDEVRRVLGGVHSAKTIHLTFDFADVEALQSAGDWEGAGAVLADGARRLEAAGAELLVLCTNTMHLVAPGIEAAVSIPLLHIAEPTADAALAAGARRVGLLGTRFTMEQRFLIDRLEARGLAVLVPEEPDRTTVHDVIYGELVRGVVTAAAKAAYVAVVERLVARGAEAIVAGCTEIELLLAPDDVPVPLLRTARLHAQAAAATALGR